MSVAEIQERNRTLAEQINQEARSNPESPYRDKLVGIANGQVVVVADNWKEVAQRLREIEPDARKTFGLEASRDYSEVERV